MMKKIVVACDSFKGSLSSKEVSQAVAAGVHDVNAEIEVKQVPVADGGEGTMQVIAESLNARIVTCSTKDALGREIEAQYAVAIIDGVTTAIIDMASASGLTLIAPEERQADKASTYGTGMMLVDAWHRQCRQFIIGIGGSATTDAGKGMLEALGVKFLDNAGNELPCGGVALNRLAALNTENRHDGILSAPVTIICDVDNPLYGPKGAAYVFSPQKGASPEMVKVLDSGLQQFARVVEAATGRSIALMPGAGAAGGLGAAFAAFFDHATLKSGIDTVLDIARFDDALAGASLVITGEGRSDAQTLHGKVPFGVLKRAGKVPVVILSGGVEDAQVLSSAGFAAALSVTQGPQSLADAMLANNARFNVRKTAAQLINLIEKICSQQ